MYDPTREIAVSLNGSARAIWDLCRSRLSVGEIVAELGRRHGVTPHLLRLDIEGAIARLCDLGLLRPAEPAAAPPDDEATSPRT